ncbi:MAG: nicotinamidase [Thaumarchaeota archaeon]|nr:nicotinamidase [Nitrososphaerota archaeon]
MEVTVLRAALVVVDVQRDFCPGGTLAVREGDKVVPGLNRTIVAFEKIKLPIFFTRDWHPPNHVSFKSQGGTWPPHCIQGTEGAEFHPDLRIPLGATIISKGDRPKEEAYSGFQGTDLAARLNKLGTEDLFLGGLATDYCVKQTTLDARAAGFSVTVLGDCISAVDVIPGDGDRALAEMKGVGAKSTKSSEAVKILAGRRP